jgi:hypothetical protein
MAVGSDLCAKFQEFLSTLRTPKAPETLINNIKAIVKSPPPLTHTQTQREGEKILQKIHIQTKISLFLLVRDGSCKLESCPS